jgi:acyl carrier protein
MDIQDKVSKIVEELGGKPSSIVPIYKQLNSLSLVELIIRLETTFKIEISVVEYDPRQFDSLESMTLMVRNKINT